MPERRRAGRLVLALFAAALAASTLAGAVLLGRGGLDPLGMGAGGVAITLFGVVFAGLIPALLTAVLIGYPIHRLLSWRGLRAMPWYLAAGAAAAIPLALLFGLETAPEQRLNIAFPILLAAGVAGSAAFWLVLRPDRA